MKCPKCDVEMKESIEKVKIYHFPGVKEKTLKEPSPRKHVYQCPSCGARYYVGLTLIPIESEG